MTLLGKAGYFLPDSRVKISSATATVLSEIQILFAEAAITASFKPAIWLRLRHET